MQNKLVNLQSVETELVVMPPLSSTPVSHVRGVVASGANPASTFLFLPGDSLQKLVLNYCGYPELASIIQAMGDDPFGCHAKVETAQRNQDVFDVPLAPEVLPLQKLPATDLTSDQKMSLLNSVRDCIKAKSDPYIVRHVVVTHQKEKTVGEQLCEKYVETLREPEGFMSPKLVNLAQVFMIHSARFTLQFLGLALRHGHPNMLYFLLLELLEYRSISTDFIRQEIDPEKSSEVLNYTLVTHGETLMDVATAKQRWPFVISLIKYGVPYRKGYQRPLLEEAIKENDTGFLGKLYAVSCAQPMEYPKKLEEGERDEKHKKSGYVSILISSPAPPSCPVNPFVNDALELIVKHHKVDCLGELLKNAKQFLIAPQDVYMWMQKNHQFFSKDMQLHGGFYQSLCCYVQDYIQENIGRVQNQHDQQVDLYLLCKITGDLLGQISQILNELYKFLNKLRFNTACKKWYRLERTLPILGIIWLIISGVLAGTGTFNSGANWFWSILVTISCLIVSCKEARDRLERDVYLSDLPREYQEVLQGFSKYDKSTSLNSLIDLLIPRRDELEKYRAEAKRLQAQLKKYSSLRSAHVEEVGERLAVRPAASGDIKQPLLESKDGRIARCTHG
jgi:hypothetical protein